MSPEAASGGVVVTPVPSVSKLDRLAGRVFSFPAFLSLALITLVVLTARSKFSDPDLWWHLKVGQVIWTTGTIPHADLFSYTTGNHPWIAHEWLSQAVIYGVYRFGGYSGLMLLLCGLSSAVCVLLYVVSAVYSGNVKVALLGGMLGWFFGTTGMAIRPLLFGYLFLVLELLLLHLSRARNRNWAWALPPLFALWVNCHPSYPLGLLVLALYWLSFFADFRAGSLVGDGWDKRDRSFFGWILAASAAALLVNPIGIRLPLYPFDLFLHQSENLANISEWRPLDVRDPRDLVMLGIAALVFALVLIRRAELRVSELALLTLGLALGIRHHRMLVVFGILTAPLLCRLLAGYWERYAPERDSRLGNVLMMLLAAGVSFWAFPDRGNIERQIADNNPVRAVEFIRRAGLSGPMLNDYGWGGYLIWAMPEQKVFIDGRADIFDWTGVMREYGRWATLEDDPARLLDKYGVRYCLLQRSAPMSRVLPYLPGWREVYQDDQAVIFARSR